MPAPDPHPTRDLSRLLAGMAPVLDPTPWAFCRVPEGRLPDGVEPVATVREVEGLTAVVAAADAARLGWPVVFAARRIILTVHSDLEAVGFMARVSAALAEHGIPCNVAAGIAHDHLFVPAAAAGAALARLAALAARPGLRFRLVDVFTDRAYAGNGLAVFPEAAGLTAPQMQAIAAELRQVESIFLERTPEPRRVRARIFTPEEELPFAGHPSLGAAAVLHEEMADGSHLLRDFDAAGNLVREKHATTADLQAGRLLADTEYQVNGFGKLVAKVEHLAPAAGDRTEAKRTTAITYDAAGRLETVAITGDSGSPARTFAP